MFNFKNNFKKLNSNTKKLYFFILIAVISFAFITIFQAILESFYNPNYHLSIHIVLEFFSITVSFVIAIQAKHVYPHTYSRRILLIGAIFLAVGVFDLLHVLTYDGMPYFFGESSVQKGTWFWILARLTQTIGILFIFVFKEKNTTSDYEQWFYPLSILYTLICSFIVFNFENDLFLLVVEGQGTTPIKNMLEYFICLLILISIFLISREYKKTKEIYFADILIAFAFIFLGELFFTTYINVTDFTNFIGHLFKATGFYFFMKATFYKSTTEPYIKMRYLAYFDTLTGLPNRSQFIELCTRTIKELKKANEKAAVIFLDIDQFKKINDTLGHNVGDMFIKNVALRLEALSGENIVVARMGGDEFALLFPNFKHQKEVNHFVNKILFSFKKPHKLHGEEIRLTASLGISIYPDDGDDINVLMRKADIAMFRAKKDVGRYYYFYSSDMDTNSYDSLIIEQQLRKALHQKELILFYQPQINLKTEEVVGFEALVRWNHPNRGILSPGVFIPIAEQTGLIIEIGNWILKEACKQIKQWHQQGLDGVKISVNLSLRQFIDPNLSNNIKEILEEVGLNAKFLILEITESMALDGEQTIKTLQQLKEIGIEIAMDDFGTGYSSFSSLKAFPIDQLKMDQSFIRELDEQNKAIVSTIISMANHLNLRVVAEGVETLEQLKFLKASACDEAQGYYIEKPLPPNKIEEKFINVTKKKEGIKK